MAARFWPVISEARSRLWRPPFPLDAMATLRPMWLGPGDPQTRLEGGRLARATRTPEGPATLLVEQIGEEVLGKAWGPGAEWLLEAMPRLLGDGDQPQRLVARHPVIADLQRRRPGLRLLLSDNLFEVLLPAIISQKVTGLEARRSHRQLIRGWGEPAPGPLGLMLPPTAERLAATPYWAYHPLGLERRRADTIRAAAAVADRLQSGADDSYAEGRRRLLAVPGIGEWTAAEALRLALGAADAVSIGDYHIPNMVSWALAGEPRADDARMLQLLEPYAGQRARVVLLLESGGPRPPRYGPRLAPRSIAAI